MVWFFIFHSDCYCWYFYTKWYDCNFCSKYPTLQSFGLIVLYFVKKLSLFQIQYFIYYPHIFITHSPQLQYPYFIRKYLYSIVSDTFCVSFKVQRNSWFFWKCIFRAYDCALVLYQKWSIYLSWKYWTYHIISADREKNKFHESFFQLYYRNYFIFYLYFTLHILSSFFYVRMVNYQ